MSSPVTFDRSSMALHITHQMGGSLWGGPFRIHRGTSSPHTRASTFVNVSSIWKTLMPEFNFWRIKEPKPVRSPPDIESACLASVAEEEENPREMVNNVQLQLALTEESSTEMVKVQLEYSSTEEEEEVAVRKEEEGRRGVPVYVMLPLDTVKSGGGLHRKKTIDASMSALRGAGVEGVMMDVWWGLVERDAPGEYDWSAYVKLMNMARKHKLKVQAVMSFHHCGSNVGDSCTIALPRWVVGMMDREGDLAYTDRYGGRSREYVSLGCDTVPVLRGRTPVQCYKDFMTAFRDRFRCLLGSTIVEIQVGMGPAGELRYPSYLEQNGTWRFPGIGAFQCYDKYMLRSLKKAAEEEGKPEWGHGGPTDAGGYNNWPEDTPFFRRNGGWSTYYGKFFLTWYSQQLIDHGERIISSANSIFLSDPSVEGVTISVKVAGIHWHYGTRSHAPELTAGYYNTRAHDGYLPIARMLRRHNAAFNFTCLEMKDWEHPVDAKCMPEALVRQVGKAAREAKVELSGENALPRYDKMAYEQILNSAIKDGGGGDGGRKEKKIMHGFTYLRMCQDLFHPGNWKEFVSFVKKMAAGNGGGGDERFLEQVERDSRAPPPSPSLTREPASVSLMSGEFEMKG